MRLARASRIGLPPNDARSRALPPASAARPRRFLDSWRGLLRRLRRGRRAPPAPASHWKSARRPPALPGPRDSTAAPRCSAPASSRDRGPTRPTWAAFARCAVRTRRASAPPALRPRTPRSRSPHSPRSCRRRPGAERTGFARPVNVSIDDCALPRRADLSGRTRQRLRLALRDRRLSRRRPLTRRPSAVEHPAGGFHQTTVRRRGGGVVVDGADRPLLLPPTGRLRARFLARPLHPLRLALRRYLLRLPRAARGSSTIVMRSSAGARGGSLSILTPVAGSPRSIAW